MTSKDSLRARSWGKASPSQMRQTTAEETSTTNFSLQRNRKTAFHLEIEGMVQRDNYHGGKEGDEQTAEDKTASRTWELITSYLTQCQERKWAKQRSNGPRRRGEFPTKLLVRF